MIFIPGNVPSSKNSKIATAKGVFNSKTVANYLRQIGVQAFSHKHGVTEFKRRENLFRKSVGQYFDGIAYPAIIGFHFIRDSKRKFDFHNAVQIVADLLVAHRFISDDNMDCMIPIPLALDGKWYAVDKTNAGVWIKIMATPHYEAPVQRKCHCEGQCVGSGK
jgi:hypothetical protein